MRRRSVFKSSDTRSGGLIGLVVVDGAQVAVVVELLDAEEGMVREPTLHARIRQTSPRFVMTQKSAVTDFRALAKTSGPNCWLC